MNEIESFKAKVEAFLAQASMTPTQFGKRFARDPVFVFQLREGREPRFQTRQKILWLMALESVPQVADED